MMGSKSKAVDFFGHLWQYISSLQEVIREGLS